MTDLPQRVHIVEEGPREGFQFEKGAIPTARKIALIDALSQTGLDHIQIVSFVNPKAVPGMGRIDVRTKNARSEKAVDRNGQRLFQTNQGVKGAFGAAKRFHP